MMEGSSFISRAGVFCSCDSFVAGFVAQSETRRGVSLAVWSDVGTLSSPLTAINAFKVFHTGDSLQWKFIAMALSESNEGDEVLHIVAATRTGLGKWVLSLKEDCVSYSEAEANFVIHSIALNANGSLIAVLEDEEILILNASLICVAKLKIARCEEMILHFIEIDTLRSFLMIAMGAKLFVWDTAREVLKGEEHLSLKTLVSYESAKSSRGSRISALNSSQGTIAVAYSAGGVSLLQV